MTYFEDVVVGEVLESRPYRVTKEEIIEFATQWDPQPFHIDEEYAATTELGLIGSGIPDKTDPGDCGCGEPDLDIDGGGVSECIEECSECDGGGTSITFRYNGSSDTRLEVGSRRDGSLFDGVVSPGETVTLIGPRRDSRFENEVTFEYGSASHALHMSCSRPNLPRHGVGRDRASSRRQPSRRPCLHGGAAGTSDELRGRTGACVDASVHRRRLLHDEP